MPCGCFGKTKKKPEECVKKVHPDSPPNTPTTDNEANKTSKRRDVVASYCEDECALLGYRPTGSRPSSSYVDSPANNSHTHTPSTVPVMVSSNASQASSIGSSPTLSRTEASSRADLAEMRREFFKDLILKEERPQFNTSLPSTLPTVARARHFGKVRAMRPVSQPSSPNDPPIFEIPPPPPPGPHLLRPLSASRRSPTHLDNVADKQVGGFASSEFLRELKTVSDGITMRWAMSDDEDIGNIPSNLKIRKVDHPETEIGAVSGKPGQQGLETNNNNNNNYNNNVYHSPTNLANEPVVLAHLDFSLSDEVKHPSSFIDKESLLEGNPLTREPPLDKQYEEFTQSTQADSPSNEFDKRDDFERKIDDLVNVTSLHEDPFDISDDEYGLEDSRVREQTSSYEMQRESSGSDIDLNTSHDNSRIDYIVESGSEGKIPSISPDSETPLEFCRIESTAYSSSEMKLSSDSLKQQHDDEWKTHPEGSQIDRNVSPSEEFEKEPELSRVDRSISSSETFETQPELLRVDRNVSSSKEFETQPELSKVDQNVSSSKEFETHPEISRIDRNVSSSEEWETEPDFSLLDRNISPTDELKTQPVSTIDELNALLDLNQRPEADGNITSSSDLNTHSESLEKNPMAL